MGHDDFPHDQGPRSGRRLLAILAADVVGYSRLLAADEQGTLRALDAQRSRLAERVVASGGRVVDAVGDNLLAVFASAVDATRCALDAQRVMEAANAGTPPERVLKLRIGIHLGDVAVDGERVVGDAVNTAARIEGQAPPGGVCASAVVLDQLAGRLPVDSVDLGERELKNLATPLRLYSLSPPVSPAASVRSAPAPGGETRESTPPESTLLRERRARLRRALAQDLLPPLPGRRVRGRGRDPVGQGDGEPNRAHASDSRGAGRRCGQRRGRHARGRGGV